MDRDGSGNLYFDIQNFTRVTYIKQLKRPPEKNWAGTDVIRIQAYNDPNDPEIKSLRPGAEIPIQSEDTILELIQHLCELIIKIRKEEK